LSVAIVFDDGTYPGVGMVEQARAVLALAGRRADD
jgi:hypothetical protein